MPVTIRCPAAELPPGDYRVRFTVSNEKDPNEYASADLTLRIQPALDLRLDPAEQSGVDTGVFEVQVRNLGAAEQVVWLDASDAEGACRYDFTPAPAVKLSPDAARPERVQLTIRPGTPLQLREARAYVFTVTARLSNAAGVVLQACQGHWTQTPPAPPSVPSVQLTLDPRKQHAAKKGSFALQLVNGDQLPLTVHLDASDPGQQCQYTFEAQEVALGGGEQRLVWLTVQPQRERADTKRMTCTFTVTVSTTETPRRPLAEATGTWTPRGRLSWLPWAIVAFLVLASVPMGLLVQALVHQAQYAEGTQNGGIYWSVGMFWAAVALAIWTAARDIRARHPGKAMGTRTTKKRPSWPSPVPGKPSKRLRQWRGRP